MFATFGEVRQSRSVWTARAFSTAFRRAMTGRQIQPPELQVGCGRFSLSPGERAGVRASGKHFISGGRPTRRYGAEG
jgi:hypothetical protein